MKKLICALALAVCASFAGAQVVERGRTFADLTATHPCSAALENRIARVTDCDAADDIGDGDGAFQCWALCDGSAPWAAVSIGAGSGGLPGNDEVTEAMLKAVNGATDEYLLTYESTVGDFEWVQHAPTASALAANGANCSAGSYPLGVDAAGAVESCTAAGTLGGSTGAADDKLLCSDGTGGVTLGVCTVGDLDNLRLDGNTLSSTNANGDIIFDPNGTGSTYLSDLGSATDPTIAIGDDNTGIYAGSAGYMQFTFNGAMKFYTDGGQLYLYTPGFHVTWGAGGTPGLYPEATGILRVTDGSPTTTDGWIMQDGNKALAADYTNATASMTNVAGLTVTLKAGRKYTWRMVARFSDDVAADGAVFDFEGGTATATDFTANCQAFDTALLLSADSTALATDFSITTATGASKIVCDGSFEVNAAGTFIPRASQEAHTTGTLTIERGSFIGMTDASFN